MYNIYEIAILGEDDQVILHIAYTESLYMANRIVEFEQQYYRDKISILRLKIEVSKIDFDSAERVIEEEVDEWASYL